LTFIGNDIVDLSDTDNIGKSADSRFRQRVFTSDEQERIASAADPDLMLWAIWAAKEAAYKIVNKSDLLAVFTPRRYSVFLPYGGQGSVRSGRVDTPLGPVVVRIDVTRDYLHCIGATLRPGVLDHVIWDIERFSAVDDARDHDLSMAVRRLAGRRLSAMLNRPAMDIDIRRFNETDRWGPPAPYLGEQPLPFDLSLSHDGAFVACAMIPVLFPVAAPSAVDEEMTP
jgi:hypothetical protein